MADTLQPTNRYVHFPAELIPSDHLAYISLSRTDTEIPQLALAYETLRDEDKRREYDLIHPLIRQTPDPPTTQRLRRSLAPPALQQPRAVSRSYNMSPEAHRNLQNAGVVSMQARDAARKMEERAEIAIERTRRFREAREAARVTSYGGTRQARASVCYYEGEWRKIDGGALCPQCLHVCMYQLLCPVCCTNTGSLPVRHMQRTASFGGQNRTRCR
jgi:hypothetical protein